MLPRFWYELLRRPVQRDCKGAAKLLEVNVYNIPAPESEALRAIFFFLFPSIDSLITDPGRA